MGQWSFHEPLEKGLGGRLSTDNPPQNADLVHPGLGPTPAGSAPGEGRGLPLFTAALRGGYAFTTHSRDEKMRAWRSELTCPKPHSHTGAELDLTHRLMNSKARVLSLLPHPWLSHLLAPDLIRAPWPLRWAGRRCVIRALSCWKLHMCHYV